MLSFVHSLTNHQQPRAAGAGVTMHVWHLLTSIRKESYSHSRMSYSHSRMDVHGGSKPALDYAQTEQIQTDNEATLLAVYFMQPQAPSISHVG